MAFPSTSVLDNFNRANGSLGGGWGGDTAYYSIASNQCNVDYAGWHPIAYATTEYGTDQEVYVTVATRAGTESAYEIFVKMQTSAPTGDGDFEAIYIYWAPGASGTFAVESYDTTNGYQTRGSWTGQSLSNGDVIGARCEPDGTLTVYKNGTEVGSCDCSGWPYYDQTGYIGLAPYVVQNARLDDFGGGDFAAGGTTIGLTGVASTSAVGSLGKSLAKQASGIAAASALGVAVATVALAASGIEATSAAGEMVSTSGLSIGLSGVEMASATGALAHSRVCFPIGIGMTIVGQINTATIYASGYDSHSFTDNLGLATRGPGTIAAMKDGSDSTGYNLHAVADSFEVDTMSGWELFAMDALSMPGSQRIDFVRMKYRGSRQSTLTSATGLQPYINGTRRGLPNLFTTSTASYQQDFKTDPADDGQWTVAKVNAQKWGWAGPGSVFAYGATTTTDVEGSLFVREFSVEAWPLVVVPTHSIALTGVGITAATGALALSADLAAVGIEATSAVGEISSAADLVLGLTGVASAFAIEAVALASDLGIAGVEAASEVGTITATTGTAVAVSGVEATFALSAPTVAAVLDLSGISATAATGVVTSGAALVIGLTGVATTSAAGALARAVVLDATGTQVAFALGTAGIAAVLDLSGVASIAAVGTMGSTSGLNLVVSGVAASFAAGALSKAVVLDAAGVEAAFAEGAIVVAHGAVVALTGSEAAFTLGSMGAVQAPTRAFYVREARLSPDDVYTREVLAEGTYSEVA